MPPLKPKTPSAIRQAALQEEQKVACEEEKITKTQHKTGVEPVFLPKTPPKLNLGALDQVDLRILSACLQDSLVTLADCRYLKKEARFVAMFNRFCWESVAQHLSETQRQIYYRCHTALTIERVKQVQYRHLDKAHCGDWMHLLCLKYIPDNPDESSREGQLALTPSEATGYSYRRSLGEGRVELTFAGGGSLRLWTSRLNITLRDMAHPWPTSKRPQHNLGGVDPHHQYIP